LKRTSTDGHLKLYYNVIYQSLSFIYIFQVDREKN